MKKLLAIIALGLLFSGNANAEIIKLKCIDEIDKNTLEPIIDTKNKTAIVGRSKNTVSIEASHYNLRSDGINIYINRYTGGYKMNLITTGKRVLSRGTCYRDPKVKF